MATPSCHPRPQESVFASLLKTFFDSIGHERQFSVAVAQEKCVSAFGGNAVLD
jgi:hypothetical protein